MLQGAEIAAVPLPVTAVPAAVQDQGELQLVTCNQQRLQPLLPAALPQVDPGDHRMTLDRPDAVALHQGLGVGPDLIPCQGRGDAPCDPEPLLVRVQLPDPAHALFEALGAAGFKRYGEHQRLVYAAQVHMVDEDPLSDVAVNLPEHHHPYVLEPLRDGLAVDLGRLGELDAAKDRCRVPSPRQAQESRGGDLILVGKLVEEHLVGVDMDVVEFAGGSQRLQDRQERRGLLRSQSFHLVSPFARPAGAPGSKPAGPHGPSSPGRSPGSFPAR